MKVKTAEMTLLALNWAVAKYEGKGLGSWTGEMLTLRISQGVRPPDYSGDWSQGGPIIEREEIGIKRNAPCSAGREWEASPSITAKGAGGRYGYGPTPLIAAMRCYVASKLGDEIEIPEELK